MSLLWLTVVLIIHIKPQTYELFYNFYCFKVLVTFIKIKPPLYFLFHSLKIIVCIYIYILYMLCNTALYSVFFLRRKGLRHNLRLISFIFNRHRDGVCTVVLAQGFPVSTTPPFSFLTLAARTCNNP